MKTNEIKDLHNKTIAEIITQLKAAQTSIMTLKLDHQQNKLKNTSSISNTRKEIAILQTILNMKQKIEAKAKTEEPVTKKVTEKKTKEKEVKS